MALEDHDFVLLRRHGGTGDSHSLHLDIAQILVYLFRVQGEVDFVGWKPNGKSALVALEKVIVRDLIKSFICDLYE